MASVTMGRFRLNFKHILSFFSFGGGVTTSWFIVGIFYHNTSYYGNLFWNDLASFLCVIIIMATRWRMSFKRNYRSFLPEFSTYTVLFSFGGGVITSWLTVGILLLRAIQSRQTSSFLLVALRLPIYHKEIMELKEHFFSYDFLPITMRSGLLTDSSWIRRGVGWLKGEKKDTDSAEMNRLSW